MKWRYVFYLALFPCAVLATTPSFAGLIVDQSSLHQTGSGSGTDAVTDGFWISQTVTTRVPGKLALVDLEIARAITAVDNLVLQIRGVTGLSPNSNILYSTTIPISSLPLAVGGGFQTSLVTFDLTSSNLKFSAGDKFAILLGRSGGSNNISNWVVWSENFSPPYPGGSDFLSTNHGISWTNLGGDVSDNAFRTWVDVSLSDVLQGAVKKPVASGPAISTSFQPNFVTLGDAATVGDFDHFNWVQVAKQYPGFLIANVPPPLFVVSPFLDPPLGGANGQPADNLPFYWDEGNDPRLLPQYLLTNKMICVAGGVACTVKDPNQLLFDDKPADSFIPPGSLDHIMEFYTSLVGVKSDGSWVPLDTFNWTSNYDGLIGGIIGNNGRNVDPVSGGTGGVLSVQQLTNPLDVPPDVLKVWLDNGARLQAVPQSGSVTLLSAGLLFLIAYALVQKKLRTKTPK